MVELVLELAVGGRLRPLEAGALQDPAIEVGVVVPLPADRLVQPVLEVPAAAVVDLLGAFQGGHDVGDRPRRIAAGGPVRQHAIDRQGRIGQEAREGVEVHLVRIDERLGGVQPGATDEPDHLRLAAAADHPADVVGLGVSAAGVHGLLHAQVDLDDLPLAPHLPVQGVPGVKRVKLVGRVLAHDDDVVGQALDPAFEVRHLEGLVEEVADDELLAVPGEQVVEQLADPVDPLGHVGDIVDRLAMSPWRNTLRSLSCRVSTKPAVPGTAASSRSYRCEGRSTGPGRPC